MLERKERLNEVYEHLHNQCGVHTKAEFADRIQYARAYEWAEPWTGSW